MPALAIAGAVMAAVGVATSIGASVAAATPTKSEKERAARLAAMRRNLEAGEFGLSPQEAAELASIGQGIVAGAEREAIARQGELAALQGISGGALIQQQLASEEAIRAQRSQVERELRQQELQARQMDLQELANLEAQVSADQMRKKQATVQAVQDVGTAATSAGFGAMNTGMMTGGPGAPPPATGQPFDAQTDLAALRQMQAAELARQQPGNPIYSDPSFQARMSGLIGPDGLPTRQAYANSLGVK
tara:strand:+ start:3755 stop:4498 length:744 start_codon:yes stop_codon:yes gene_type:complete